MNPVATLTPPWQPLPRRSAFGCIAASALLLALLVVHAAPARADIWGYVDEKGIPHFSASQLDDRYELFLREQNEPEPYRVQPVNKPVTAATSGTAAATATATTATTATAAVATVAPETSPPVARMKVSFEELPSYKSVQHLLREASTKHGIDYALLQALIATESGFNSRAVSPKGAVGLMQLIPPTAERYGVKGGKDATIEMKLTDPAVNIRAGSRYLSDLIKMFPGQIELALAAYNAGEGAVQRAGNKIPNYPETKNYVKTVMQLYGVLKPAVKGQTVITTGAAPGRVRVEMVGGSSGRGNMVPSTPQPAASPRARAGRD